MYALLTLSRVWHSAIQNIPPVSTFRAWFILLHNREIIYKPCSSYSSFENCFRKKYVEIKIFSFTPVDTVVVKFCL